MEAEPGSEALASGNVAELVKASLGFLGMRVTVAQIKFLMCLKFCLRLSAEVVYPSGKKSGVDICKYLFSCYFSLNEIVLFDDSLSWSIIHSNSGLNIFLIIVEILLKTKATYAFYLLGHNNRDVRNSYHKALCLKKSYL